MGVILLCCIGTDSNISNPHLLRHFVNHYKRLGIEEWELTLHIGPAAIHHNYLPFRQILKKENLRYDEWNGPFNTFERESRHNAFVASQGEQNWVVGVDLDELVDFPCSIPMYLERLASAGENCLGGVLVDRIASEGTLKKISREPALAEQFPLQAEVKKGIYRPLAEGAPFEKKVAIKRPLRWGVGHHYIERETRRFSREAKEKLRIDHYAWDELLIGRIQQRLGDPWAREYRNMIDYIARHGKIRPEDVQS